jgi:3-oxoacyl-[acyl-carrier-protein] synthase II
LSRSVAITGVGAVTPLGVGAEPLYERWLAGETGIGDGVARCTDFDPADHLSKTERLRTDRFSQLTVVAGHEAMEQAGLAKELGCDPYRVACVIATVFGGVETVEHQHRVLTQRGERFVQPLGMIMAMPNAAAMSLSMRYGLRGESCAMTSACAAGCQAIGTAMRLIRSDEADVVVAGGGDAPITPLSRAGFEVMGALSPSGSSRPFDRDRDGFVLGEGAAVLVLERPDHARARGAEILGEAVGYGASSDAFHVTIPDPEGRGAAVAIRRALADSGLEPDDIDYVNAHGTGTPLNDPAETKALESALGERVRRVPISSTKSVIGHLQGAAGAAEVVATLMALRDGVAPPTVGLEHPETDLNYVREPTPLESDGPHIALSNSFGFGGHNSSLILQAAA